MSEESMTRLEVFSNLGYKRDPFTGGVQYSTGDSLRVSRILTMAVESRAMVSIVGERGIGKSDAVSAALGKMKIRRANVEKLDKKTITIDDIRIAMMTDLSTEDIKRGGEINSRQLRRVIGSAATADKNTTIVLVIEEAQRLHPNTLKSLKTLREMEWLGQKELFAIILIAQSDPMARPGVSEVALRSDCVRMRGLSPEEASGYLRAMVGKHFEDAAMDAMAEITAARNWLELQALAVEMLNVALADGRDVVTLKDVQTAAGRQAVALPKGPGRSQATAISGKSALQNVLSKGKDGERPGVVHA